MSRTVTVFSTSGDSRGQEVVTAAANWGALQSALGAAQPSINYQGMKAIEGQTRVTFESNDAILPEGDFRLFLMPIRTKRGGDPKDTYENPPAKENAGDPGVEVEPEIPNNVFGKLSEEVHKALTEFEMNLDEVDKLRLVLMRQDLYELGLGISETADNPFATERREIQKSLKS